MKIRPGPPSPIAGHHPGQPETGVGGGIQMAPPENQGKLPLLRKMSVKKCRNRFTCEAYLRAFKFDPGKINFHVDVPINSWLLTFACNFSKVVG